MFEHIQDEVNARIEAFVADISELARSAARETLTSTLGSAGSVSLPPRRFSAGPARRQRTGGKRTAEEISETAEALYTFISENPGQRMEAIARAMDSTTQELTLPIRKLMSANRIATEGQKRATSYYAADSEEAPSGSSGRRRRQKRN